MKKNLSAAALLEKLAPPKDELQGGVAAFYHDELFAEARKGGRLAGQIAELVQACYADELHCKLSQFHFNGFAQRLIKQGHELVSEKADVRSIRRCADAMNLNIMAERLAYKEYYAKLETALLKLEEVRNGVTFTFNGRSTRMDKDGEKKKAIIRILGQHTRSIADTLEQYKDALDTLAVQHDNLRALCEPAIAKAPSLPKALKR